MSGQNQYGQQAQQMAGGPMGQAARGMAQDAGRYGAQQASAGIQELGAYIEKGNDGLAILAFIGNLLIVLSAFIGMLNIADTAFRPIHYVINAYQLVFASCGMVLEAQESWIEKSAQLQKAQTMIFEFAKFLTELWGRGAFYVFQASLAMCHMSIIYILVGVYMLIVGALTIAMHFSPETAKKVVKVGVSGLQEATGPYAAKYERVDGQ